MTTVKDIVRGQDTAAVDRQTSVAEAALIMSNRRIGAVPETDGDRGAGHYPQRAALSPVLADGLDPAATPVCDVMSSSLVVAGMHENYETCLERMREARVRHLIIMDDDRMAGVVSMRDLMAVALDDRAETITLLSEY